MSESSTETAYERGRRHGETGTGPGAKGGSNFLTNKLGPFPVWVWAALGLLSAIAFYVWQKKNTSSAVSSTTAQSSTSGTTDSSLIPQFVNQVYTNGTPPPAHNPRGGVETKPPSTTPTGSQSNWSSPYIVAVPNGSGGWMEAVFPNQTAVNNFYTGIGYNNGYPLGLNNSQISAAVSKAGGNVAGTVANSGPGGLLQ
jgi:hypothetical protein